LCARRDLQEVRKAAALVRFDMREGNVPQLRDRKHGLDLLPDEREQLARPGVEQQRLFVDDEVLVEREAARHHVRQRTLMR
jgi:hypothetical protein